MPVQQTPVGNGNTPKGQKGKAGVMSSVKHLDGRNERLHSNVREDGDKTNKVFEELKQKLADAEEDKDGQQKQFEKFIKELATTAKDLGNDIKRAIQRITRSKSDHDMSESVNILKALSF